MEKIRQIKKIKYTWSRKYYSTIGEYDDEERLYYYLSRESKRNLGTSKGIPCPYEI